jgi:PAS domain S-box-containing protein
MKLKTQLIITLSIFILISVIIISAIIIANEKLQNTNRNEKLIIDIESGYFELSHLESDYLINKGDREIEQWRSKYAIISDQIDELQLEDLDEKSLSANMKAGHVQLEPLFSDFISDKNSAGSTVSVSSRDERQGFRWSSLAMQTEKVTYDANELMRLLRTDATATLEWFNIIILLSISMLLVSSVISYALITRSVIESLSRLRSGIEQVGSGELDARVDTGTDDELGDLALLFNEMADKLKMVMARKSELEKEVAERKRAEEQLKESETRYREFFTTSRDCVFITSPDGRFIDFNDATLEMFGYDNREEMSNVSIPSLYAHSEDRSAFLNLIVRDGYVKEFPVQLKRRDGTVIDSLVTGVPLRNPDGTIKALIGTARDITERKRAELELVSAQESLKEAHRLAHIGIWDWVIENDMVTWSEELFNIAGRDPSLQAPTYAEHSRVYAPASWDRLSSAVTRALTSGEPYNLELELVRTDGSIRWINAFGGVKRDGKGKVIGLQGTVQDINERKRAEQEIMLLNATLEQRVRDRTQELEQATETIRGSLDEKVILLREIHHRVKNNLQILISLLNLQSRTITDPQIIVALKESTQRIRAMSMVHEKLYSGSDLAHIDFISYLSSLAKSQVEFYRLGPGKVTLETTGKNIMLDINIAIPLGLVMNELLSNALKHAFPGDRKGTIRIDARKTKDRFEISIADDGVGLPEGFDYINSQSLGLRLVHILIEQLSGTIELKKEKGTTFNIVVKEKQ